MRGARWFTVSLLMPLGLPVREQEVRHLIDAAVPGICNDLQFGGAGTIVGTKSPTEMLGAALVGADRFDRLPN